MIGSSSSLCVTGGLPIAERLITIWGCETLDIYGAVVLAALAAFAFVSPTIAVELTELERSALLAQHRGLARSLNCSTVMARRRSMSVGQPL